MMSDDFRNPDLPDAPELLQVAWQKLLTLILWKYRDVLPDVIVITRDDVAELTAEPSAPGVLADGRSDGIHVQLRPEADLLRLARESHGRPS